MELNSIPGRLQLEYPPEGQLRARKVVTRSRARATIKHPSWKVGRMVQCESKEELAVYKGLDCDPAVSSYSEQPLTIYYQIGEEVRAHYPDTLVEYPMSKELLEIKDEKGALEEGIQLRTKILQELLPRVGYQYKLIVAREYCANPRFVNNEVLLKLGRTSVDMLNRERARQLFAGGSLITWGHIENRAIGELSKRIVSRLILEGSIELIEPNEKLSPESRLVWKERSSAVNA